MLEYYMLKHKPCLVVGYMFTNTESWCHNQLKILIPESKSCLSFFSARYASAVILRMHLVVMIRISLILFYNLLVLFPALQCVSPKVVAHISCFLNMPILDN